MTTRKMSDTHDSTSCTADHGQPCGECRRVRLDEIRERRSKEYGHSFTGTHGTAAAMADIDYLLSLVEPPAPDPFPLLSPPLRSLSEAQGDAEQQGIPSVFRGGEALGDPDMQAEFSDGSGHWDIPRMADTIIELRSLAEARDDELRTIEERGALATDHRDMEWVLEAPDGYAGDVSPELLDASRAMAIDPFDAAWATAPEPVKDNRLSALHWWLAGRESNRDEVARLLELDAEEVGKLLEEKLR